MMNSKAAIVGSGITVTVASGSELGAVALLAIGSSPKPRNIGSPGSPRAIPDAPGNSEILAVPTDELIMSKRETRHDPVEGS